MFSGAKKEVAITADEMIAFIENPQGTTRRWLHSKASGWFSLPGSEYATPIPTHYGALPGTFCPADKDDLDVIVLPQAACGRGSRLVVRPIGALIRADGDNKILAVESGDPDYADVKTWSDVPARRRAEIVAWYRPFGDITNEVEVDDAWAMIREAQQAEAKRLAAEAAAREAEKATRRR